MKEKRQCENCGTVWVIHILGIIPASEGLVKKEGRKCIGEYCPGCAVWLLVE